jgi:transcriptional regulator with XRE-family HTH domain
MTQRTRSKEAKQKKGSHRVPVEEVSHFKQKLAVSYLTQLVVAQLSSALIEVNEKRGWRQVDVARRLGIDETQVSRWLSGRQPNMTLETVALLSAAMDHEPEFKLRPNEPVGTCRVHIAPSAIVPLESEWEVTEEHEQSALISFHAAAHA